MKFHPIISTILGLIIAVILIIISTAAFNATSILGKAIILSAIILGGFIATYSGKYKKIKYSFYMGLILAVLFSIVVVVTDGFSLFPIITGFLFFPLVAIIGGLLGKIDYKTD